MPRKPRKDIESRYWHIMVQGIGKEYVFPDDDSKGYYLTSLQKGQEKVDIKILAFCVMSNHAHILLFAESNKKLSEYMNKVNSNYAYLANPLNGNVDVSNLYTVTTWGGSCSPITHNQALYAKNSTFGREQI